MVCVGVDGFVIFGDEVLAFILTCGGKLLESVGIDLGDALADRALR